jgi:hypothetical protein
MKDAMNPKYLRKTGPKAHICPWCEQPSPKTGNRCGHLFKIAANGVYLWYWGIRPVPNAHALAALQRLERAGRVGDGNGDTTAGRGAR